MYVSKPSTLLIKDTYTQTFTMAMNNQGTYTADNTQAYLNRTTSSSLTGVYKFSVKGELKADTYNTIKLVSGDKQVYVLVKYGNPSEVPDLSDYEGEQEETTVDPNAPTNPIGLVVGAPTGNAISVTFRSTQAQIEKAKKVSKKKIKLTFKKISKNTGYQIKISTSKKFKKKVTITRTVKKNRKVYKLAISNKKLRKAKKLYVKARAFRVVNKKRSYGKWTKAKRIKK